MGDKQHRLLRRREVHARLDLPLLSLLLSTCLAPLPIAMQLTNRIPCRHACLLRVGEKRSETRNDLAPKRGRATALAQSIFEVSNLDRRQVGQLRTADQRNDVQLDVLPVLVDRGSLKIAAGLQP